MDFQLCLSIVHIKIVLGLSAMEGQNKWLLLASLHWKDDILIILELIKSLVVVYFNSRGQKPRSLSVTRQNIRQVGNFQSGKFRDSSSCNDCRRQ